MTYFNKFDILCLDENMFSIEPSPFEGKELELESCSIGWSKLPNCLLKSAFPKLSADISVAISDCRQLGSVQRTYE